MPTATVQVTLRLSPELHEQIEDEARRREISASDFMRDAIRAHIALGRAARTMQKNFRTKGTK